MALLFIDGFDHYDNIRLKWIVSNTFDNPSFALGRFGGLALKKQFQNSAGSIRKTLAVTQNTIIVGLALYTSNESFPNDSLLTFRDSNNTVILTVSMVSDTTTTGHLEVSKPGTALAPSLDNFPTWNTQEWHYIQIKYNPNKTGGLVDIRLETNDAVYLAQGRTTEQGDNDVQSVQIMGSSTNSPRYLIDDFYIANTDGGENNDFLGQVRTSIMTANSVPGAIAKQSVGSISSITDAIVDVNTSVSMGVINSFDDYHMTPMCAYLNRASLAITYGIQVIAVSAKDNSGIIKYQQVINSTFDGVEIIPGTFNEQINTKGFFCEPQIYNTDPTDSQGWTAGKIDALHAGFRLTTREGGA